MHLEYNTTRKSIGWKYVELPNEIVMILGKWIHRTLERELKYFSYISNT